MKYIIMSVLLSFISMIVAYKDLTSSEYRLNNKCKYCLLLSPIITVLINIIHPSNTYNLFSVFWGAIIPILISQFIIDLKTQELSNKGSATILIIGICYLLSITYNTGLNSFVLLHLVTGLVLFIIYLILGVVVGGLGGGDLKLIGAVGVFFPLSSIGLLLIMPFFIGTIWSIVLLLTKKANMQSKFPFGPSIILALLLIIFI